MDQPTKKQLDSLKRERDSAVAELHKIAERTTPTEMYECAYTLREALSVLYNAQSRAHTIDSTDAACYRCHADSITKRALESSAWLEAMSAQTDARFVRASEPSYRGE